MLQFLRSRLGRKLRPRREVTVSTQDDLVELAHWIDRPPLRLMASVIHTHDRPENRTFLVVDAAMNDLVRPAMYDSFHDIRPVRETVTEPVKQDVVGPICESGDTFTRGRALPRLAPGDLVAFMTAGAYGAAMSSEYNSRLLIPEVLVKGDQFAVIRPRPTYDEMLAREPVADWLKGG